MFGRNKVAMVVAEFMGTAVLTLVVLSVRVSGIGYSLFVALGAGLAIAVMMLMVGATSGGQFNPALTAGLWTNGLWTRRTVKTGAAIVYVAAQLLGAYAAYWLYVYLAHNHLPNSAGHFLNRVLWAEAVGTFVFVFGWMAAAAQGFRGWKMAACAGGAFALGMLVASLGANGLINPALALGNRDWGWATTVLGPVIGGIVGVNLYSFLFAGDKPVLAMATTSRPAATSSSAKKRTSAKRK